MLFRTTQIFNTRDNICNYKFRQLIRKKKIFRIMGVFLNLVISGREAGIFFASLVRCVGTYWILFSSLSVLSFSSCRILCGIRRLINFLPFLLFISRAQNYHKTSIYVLTNETIYLHIVIQITQKKRELMNKSYVARLTKCLNIFLDIKLVSK